MVLVDLGEGVKDFMYLFEKKSTGTAQGEGQRGREGAGAEKEVQRNKPTLL